MLRANIKVKTSVALLLSFAIIILNYTQLSFSSPLFPTILPPDTMSDTTNFSSPDFIQNLCSQENSALEQVVRAYTTHLFRASLGMGFNQEISNELVQRCWSTFYEVVPRFKSKSHIRTFIFGILYNKAREMRREQRRLDAPDLMEDTLDKRFDSSGHWSQPPANPERFVLATETMDVIEKCLEALPLSQRQAFALKEIDEEDTEIICNILEITRTNLGVLLFRARNRLRECIEKSANQEKS